MAASWQIGAVGSVAAVTLAAAAVARLPLVLQQVQLVVRSNFPSIPFCFQTYIHCVHCNVTQDTLGKFFLKVHYHLQISSSVHVIVLA